MDSTRLDLVHIVERHAPAERLGRETPEEQNPSALREEGLKGVFFDGRRAGHLVCLFLKGKDYSRKAYSKIIRITKFWQTCQNLVSRKAGFTFVKNGEMDTTLTHTRRLICQMQRLAEELQGGSNRVLMRWRSGTVVLPDEGVQVTLNPMERTLYRLFLAHPEGISADDLPLHWQELCDIYAKESCFDDPDIREAKLESLCGESKKVFYSVISRIKRKFVLAVGLWRAQAYLIKNAGGIYVTTARPETESPCSDAVR